MQRGARDGRAGQQNGLQLGDWSKRSNAAHLNGYVTQQSLSLAGGELVGDGPSRGLGSRAQFLLKRSPVHFYDDAVDLVAQLIALALPLIAELDYFIDRPA